MSESGLNEGSSTESTAETQSVTAVPVAVIGPARITFSDLLRGSYMWLVALICLIVAIGVVWWSMPEQGLQIVIHFPDGHGLAVEDSVRFRGIDVGVVEEVKLNRELSGVDVHVNLYVFAEPLARAGTRFWIVRPQLGIGGISGLETAVGNKYIGLIPGDPEGDWQSAFEGLANSPPDAMENQGVEILLRGDRRSSVTAGSPVNYRGVVIGRVLSVELAPDGLKVDVRLRVFEKFTKLITSESRFWASGGVNAKFSALGGGFSFEMESLETLVHGGVSVLTVANGGRPIKPGDDFVLHANSDEQWYEQAELVQATDVRRRGAIPLEILWEQKGFLGRRSRKSVNIVGTHVASNEGDAALIPTDVLVLPDSAFADTLQVGIVERTEFREPLATQSLDGAEIARVALPAISGGTYPSPISQNEMRIPDQPEPCLAIRANGELEDLRFLSLSIEQENIGEQWVVKEFNGDRSVWHGSPVLSELDGKLIGILLVGEKETRISVLTETVIAGDLPTATTRNSAPE